MNSGHKPGRFPLHWVLVKELAIGPAPRADAHLDRLVEQGVCAVLSLCAVEEAPPPQAMAQRFACHRLVLPDHRSDQLLSERQLEQALQLLAELRRQGPVYVHCLAAMERSPLVCLAWLMRHHRLSLQRALDYLMQVHPGTSPLPSQLAVVRRINHPHCCHRWSAGVKFNEVERPLSQLGSTAEDLTDSFC